MAEILLRLLAKKTPEASSPLNLILKATDSTAAGSTDAFLNTKLEYTKDEYGEDVCLVKVNDEEKVGVMMGWERGISEFFPDMFRRCVLSGLVLSARNCP